MNLKLSYIILYVQDLQKSIHFYRDLLGVPLKGEYGTYVEFDTGRTILSMNTREGGREVTNLPIPDGVKTEQTFELGFTTNDVAGVIEKLRSENVKILMEPKEKPWGQVVAYVEDPDGHYIEVCTPMN